MNLLFHRRHHQAPLIAVLYLHRLALLALLRPRRTAHLTLRPRLHPIVDDVGGVPADEEPGAVEALHPPPLALAREVGAQIRRRHQEEGRGVDHILLKVEEAQAAGASDMFHARPRRRGEVVIVSQPRLVARIEIVAAVRNDLGPRTRRGEIGIKKEGRSKQDKTSCTYVIVQYEVGSSWPVHVAVGHLFRFGHDC